LNILQLAPWFRVSELKSKVLTNIIYGLFFKQLKFFMGKFEPVSIQKLGKKTSYDWARVRISWALGPQLKIRSNADRLGMKLPQSWG